MKNTEFKKIQTIILDNKEDVGNGSNYKRFFDSWDLHDGFIGDMKYPQKVKNKNKWMINW